MRGILLTVTALLCLPLQSCCSLARLFCGPDTSEWVSVNYDTPELALRTFLEALKRDDPGIIYDCLSQSFRDELGLDRDTTRIIWPKVRDQYPGLHLAGYATVPDATRVDANSAIVDLDIEGEAMRVQLVRQCHWQVRYRREGESGDNLIADVGGQVSDATKLLTVKPAMEEMSIVSLDGRRVMHSFYETLPVDAIESIALAHTWRVTGFPQSIEE